MLSTCDSALFHANNPAYPTNSRTFLNKFGSYVTAKNTGTDTAKCAETCLAAIPLNGDPRAAYTPEEQGTVNTLLKACGTCLNRTPWEPTNTRRVAFGCKYCTDVLAPRALGIYRTRKSLAGSDTQALNTELAALATATTASTSAWEVEFESTPYQFPTSSSEMETYLKSTAHATDVETFGAIAPCHRARILATVCAPLSSRSFDLPQTPAAGKSALDKPEVIAGITIGVLLFLVLLWCGLWKCAPQYLWESRYFLQTSNSRPGKWLWFVKAQKPDAYNGDKRPADSIDVSLMSSTELFYRHVHNWMTLLRGLVFILPESVYSLWQLRRYKLNATDKTSYAPVTRYAEWKAEQLAQEKFREKSDNAVEHAFVPKGYQAVKPEETEDSIPTDKMEDPGTENWRYIPFSFKWWRIHTEDTSEGLTNARSEERKSWKQNTEEVKPEKHKDTVKPTEAPKPVDRPDKVQLHVQDGQAAGDSSHVVQSAGDATDGATDVGTVHNEEEEEE